MFKDGEYGEHDLLTISVLGELWQLLFDKKKKKKKNFPQWQLSVFWSYQRHLMGAACELLNHLGVIWTLCWKLCVKRKILLPLYPKAHWHYFKQTVPTYSFTQLLAWCSLSSTHRKEKQWQVCTLLRLLSFSCFQYFCVTVLHKSRHCDCPKDEGESSHLKQTFIMLNNMWHNIF